MVISGEVQVSDAVLASSGFADIRSGTYMGRRVAVKTVRVAARDNFLKIRKVSTEPQPPMVQSHHPTQRFCKEVVLWITLSHPNVMKLAGVQGDMEKGQFATVSEWMERGNIMEFIEKNSANRLELVRDFTFPAASPIEVPR